MLLLMVRKQAPARKLRVMDDAVKKYLSLSNVS